MLEVSVILICAVLFVFAILVHQFIFSRKVYSNLPPGPPGYPLLGNVLDIKGKELDVYFELCRQKYGNIFSVRFFHKTLIVFSGYDILKEAFVENGHLFSERPRMPVLESFPGAGVLVASGQRWKTNRKFVFRVFRDFGIGRNIFQEKIHDEIQEVISQIEKYNEEPFDISLLINNAVANIICSITIGRRFKYDDKEFQDYLKMCSELAASLNILFGHPALQYIPFDPFGVRNDMDMLTKTTNFVRKHIHQHIEDFDGTNVKDLTDAYIKQMNSPTSSECDEIFNGVLVASGQRWKTNRKFVFRVFRDIGIGRNIFQEKIHDEIQEVISQIEKYNEEPFDISLLINNAVANIICSITIGRRFKYDDKEFQDYLKMCSELAASLNILFGHPALQYIPFDPFGVRNDMDMLTKTTNFVRKHIHQHIEDFDGTNVKDLTDAYIKQMNSPTSSECDEIFNESELLAIVSDLIEAGSETTATGLKWGLLSLLRNPEHQAKLHKELCESVPAHRLPNVDDKLKTPYMEATALEILRWGNIVPSGFPHGAIRDCRRICLGESLARMELFLFFSALVQRFEFVVPDGVDCPGLEYVTGTTRSPKPFMMKAVKRM